MVTFNFYLNLKCDPYIWGLETDDTREAPFSDGGHLKGPSTAIDEKSKVLKYRIFTIKTVFF